MTGRRQLLAHRDKSQSPEFTVGIDAKRTFVDKRSRPNLQRMTQTGLRLAWQVVNDVWLRRSQAGA